VIDSTNISDFFHVFKCPKYPFEHMHWVIFWQILYGIHPCHGLVSSYFLFSTAMIHFVIASFFSFDLCWITGIFCLVDCHLPGGWSKFELKTIFHCCQPTF
jgi:hypothetical protein